MPDIPDLVWFLALVAIAVALIIDARHMRQVRSQLNQIESSVNQMLHRSSSHQRSAGVGRTLPGATPQTDKAHALPRTDIPSTGRQGPALRFERKGGEDGSDEARAGLQQRGKRAPNTLGRRGGEAETR